MPIAFLPCVELFWLLPLHSVVGSVFENRFLKIEIHRNYPIVIIGTDCTRSSEKNAITPNKTIKQKWNFFVKS